MTNAMHDKNSHIARNLFFSFLPWGILYSVSIAEDRMPGHGDWAPPLWLFVYIGVVLLTSAINLLYWAITIACGTKKNRLLWFVALNHIPILLIIYVLFIAK